MKIDWKYVATTEGYKSLKAAYAHDVYKKNRSKKELREHFKWVIGRAIHYAHHENTTIDNILDNWEAKRTMWWFGYYQDGRQSKHTSGVLCRMGINGIRKLYKNDGFRRCPINRKARVFCHIMSVQKISSTKSPKRWTTKRKADYKKYGR